MLCMSVNLQHDMLLLAYQHVLLEVNQQQDVVVGLPTCVVGGKPTHHVVVGLPTCVVGGKPTRHVVVGLPTCVVVVLEVFCVVYVGKPPTRHVGGVGMSVNLQHLHIKESPVLDACFPKGNIKNARAYLCT